MVVRIVTAYEPTVGELLERWEQEDAVRTLAPRIEADCLLMRLAKVAFGGRDADGQMGDKKSPATWALVQAWDGEIALVSDDELSQVTARLRDAYGPSGNSEAILVGFDRNEGGNIDGIAIRSHSYVGLWDSRDCEVLVGTDGSIMPLNDCEPRDEWPWPGIDTFLMFFDRLEELMRRDIEREFERLD